MRTLIVLLTALLLSGCTAVQQQKAQPPATDDLHFSNLQVLPQNITREELLTTMRRFTQALGVGCDHCHVPLTSGGVTGERPEFDFPSDAKREKDVARTMIRMTQQINEGYISTIPEAHTVVTCWTCHRGDVQPAIVPSLPEREAAAD